MARRILSRGRADYLRWQKHGGVMRGNPLRYPAGVMERYQRELEHLTATMCLTTQREFEKLFRHPDVVEFVSTRHDVEAVAMDISPASQARLLAAKLRAQFEQLFSDQSKPVADRMVNQVNAASATATYNSLKELSGGLTLNVKTLSPDILEAMKLAVANNVSLIKSIPSQYFTKVEGAVYRSLTGGNGLQDLQEFFVKQYGEEGRRAKNIALDQTRKAYNNLNKERMKKHGVGKFEWLHSGGGLHPRPLHQSYHGRVFSFGNLPIIDEATGERGIPGQAVNCGCTMVPVIEFEQGEAIK